MAENPNPGPDEDPWLTVPQVSDELKLHPATVRVWINSGRLAAVRAGRTWRVRRSEVDRALLSDASPAYLTSSSSGGEPSAESPRPQAPRRLADHIMPVGPVAGEPS